MECRGQCLTDKLKYSVLTRRVLILRNNMHNGQRLHWKDVFQLCFPVVDMSRPKFVVVIFIKLLYKIIKKS